ncbi:universal stress protein [Streptomyces xanthii]|uniref:Universal stress protein n=2 Tax=Streptomyces xanthii TaxID=2768069 RepID=A0A7H1BIA7_9ACTN|nr:universal stress protein [Streptomyces xanthii]QNS08462.1 universal stress protein [Streptomyces xanthii]
MTGNGERHEIVVCVDPARTGPLATAWAADEAHRRRLALRLVVVVEPAPDTRHAVDAARHRARTEAASEALNRAAEGARTRHPGLSVSAAVMEGVPAVVLTGLAQHAAMMVLGSRHLSRTEEFLSAGSLVLPVTAQARCPVVVVGDAEHSTQEPPYVVVGIDGSTASQAALALACEEADLRDCLLRAVAVRQPPLFSLRQEGAGLDGERRLLAEATAGWAEKYPDLRITHEVLVGSPVERLAEAAEHALAVVVGRRGSGGYTGMRVGSVVHGLLHRAHCPVITVPAE